MITQHNIGAIRRFFFVPWNSWWNAWVRDVTARYEQSPEEAKFVTVNGVWRWANEKRVLMGKQPPKRAEFGYMYVDSPAGKGHALFTVSGMFFGTTIWSVDIPEAIRRPVVDCVEDDGKWYWVLKN